MATSIDQTSSKSLHLNHVITLVFLAFLLLINPTSLMTHPIHESSSKNTMASSKRFLLEPSSPSSSTMNLHPTAQLRRSHTASSSAWKSRRTKFGAQAHAVPSGPNPISN
ncbi:hypothetical protein EUTSA_v10026616mg [Eutrema salsugineum]|uniref:Uncharacterized protein n=1 Tax=Eutrema salsugineum TaxID=72664 RepID=V4P9Q1_EUTSA|nr:CLAVATA3/ESR (CLE)-related protein 44 [Eutrema salsugineum]ESQ56411.1 hypothetical protein EUTSA_v10026616mg [Eutrema salsugineum]